MFSSRVPFCENVFYFPDPSASAARKARRKMSSLSYIFRVTKTTIICKEISTPWLPFFFAPQLSLAGLYLFSHTWTAKLTVMASSWAIGTGIRIGKHLLSVAKSDTKVDWIAVLQNERKFYSPVGCLTSLILPALGAGIFSAIFRPELGHWVGKSKY